MRQTAINFEQSAGRPVWTSTSNVPFAAPEDPYNIGYGLRIVPSGVTDEQSRPEEPLVSEFGDFLTACGNDNHLDEVQLFVAPNSRFLDIIVSGVLNIRPNEENGQQRLVVESAFEKILEKAKGRLPDIYGLEKVQVDLAPLGRSAPHVSRLAVREDQQLVIKNVGFNPTVRLLRALHESRDAFVFQFILDTGKQFVGTVRLATFNPEYIKRSNRGFAEIVANGHPRSLANIYEPLHLTDNHHLHVDDYWQTSYTPQSGTPPKYNVSYSTKVTEPDYRYRQTKRQADRLKDLVTGVGEYEGLLAGSSNFDNLYEKLELYPRFRLSGPQLDYFVGIPQLQYLGSPWDELVGRDGPTIKTLEIIREADGTEQGLYQQPTVSGGDAISSSLAGTTTSRSAGVQNKGSITHDGTVTDGGSWFGEQGDHVDKIEQTTESLPDLKLYPTDGKLRSLGFDIERELLETNILPPERLEDPNVVLVEVEHKNRPASTLANAAQAAIDGRIVVFIGTSRTKTEKVAQQLARPFKSTIDDGVVLYHWTEKIVCEDGTKPVIPNDADELQWEFTYDGRLRLRQTDVEADGIIADEPAVNGPSTFDFECPSLRIENGKYIVSGPDGDILRTYSSKAAFEREWRYVYLPHVPVELSYLERSLLMYLDTEADHFELKRYHVDPDWNVSNNTGRYEKMIEGAVEEYLVEQEGTELDLKRWRQRILRLYRRQTDRKEPDAGKIGEAMPDIDTKQRNDPYQRLYVDHTFAFPEGIVSPALPGVDTDDGRILEWAE